MPPKKANKIPMKIGFILEEKGDEYMELKQFKIHNWNSSVNAEGDVSISFDIQGINKPDIFSAIFQTGKLAIEKLQGGSGSWYDIFQPLMGLVYLITDALKKSK